MAIEIFDVGEEVFYMLMLSLPQLLAASIQLTHLTTIITVPANAIQDTIRMREACSQRR